MLRWAAPYTTTYCAVKALLAITHERASVTTRRRAPDADRSAAGRQRTHALRALGALGGDRRRHDRAPCRAATPPPRPPRRRRRQRGVDAGVAVLEARSARAAERAPRTRGDPRHLHGLGIAPATAGSVRAGGGKR